MLRNLSVSDRIISYIIHTRHVSHYSLEYFCLISLYLGLCHSHDRDEDVRVGVSEVGTNLYKFHVMESMSDKIQDLLLRRRMEDEVAATQAALEAVENDSLLSPAFSSRFQNLTFPYFQVSQTSANTCTIILRAGTLSPPNRTPQNARKKNGSVPVVGCISYPRWTRTEVSSDWSQHALGGDAGGVRSGVPGGGEGGVLRPLLPPRHLEDQPGGGAVQGALHGEEREDPQEEKQETGRPRWPGQFFDFYDCWLSSKMQVSDKSLSSIYQILGKVHICLFWSPLTKCWCSGGRDGASVGEGQEGGGDDRGRRPVQILSPCRWKKMWNTLQ